MVNFENFFKPEIRSSGQSLFSKGKMTLSQPSDLEIISYVRVSKPLKVTIKLESFDSPLVWIACSCPAGGKGPLCKHMWAALLVIQEKTPAFLEGKETLEKILSSKSESLTSKSSWRQLEPSQDQAQKKDQFRQKQAQYRKDQYQKQKLRLKEMKKTKETREVVTEFPSEIKEALNYFEKNGFSLKNDLTKENVNLAMKKLARVFHPDRGGSHEEILELNTHSDILTDYTST